MNPHISKIRNLWQSASVRKSRSVFLFNAAFLIQTVEVCLCREVKREITDLECHKVR